jgi:hypothetical protein
MKKTYKKTVSYGGAPLIEQKAREAIRARTVALDLYNPVNNPQPIDMGMSTPIVQPQALFSSRGDLG